MENRRLFSFLLTSLLFLWLWSAVIAPRIMPPPRPQPVAAPVDNKAKPVAAGAPAADDSERADANEGDAGNAVAVSKIPNHPKAPARLGSLDPASGYALQLDLTSEGAAIESALLTSPQYRDLKNQNEQAVILGNTSTQIRTFSTAVRAIDNQLAATDQTLETVHWKLVSQESGDESSSVVYEYDAPDGSLRVRKTYSLPRLKISGQELEEALRSNPSLYTVNVNMEIINLSENPRTVDYEIQGPVGLLLENEEHTSKYRDIHVEFVGGAKAVTLAASTVKGYVDDLEGELGRTATVAEQRIRLRDDHEWTSAVRYGGVDVQFFAALIAPLDNRPEALRTEEKWIDRTYPVLISSHPLENRKSDISLRMASAPFTLNGKGESIDHSYALFIGPKRSELLDPEPLAAGQVLNYGWFGPVARGMHLLLGSFFNFGMPYFLAIISLTVLVRGCLFPISRKQAISAARMKELQPQLAALKAKYGDDREKFARAQMELWRKNKINPLAGCLPLFLQLPIFIGLYTALNSAVDLRLQSFLWIENLAAPDALFRLPFEIPLFGLGRDVSILPLITVALFLVQQKMFMPPAQDEQQALQYKMMNIMTGVMGFMFWHQPAGLCIYFIASSLWSIAERKLLGTGKAVSTPAGSVTVIEPETPELVAAKPARKKVAPAPAAAAKPPGFLQRLLEAAQNAREQADRQREKNDRKGKNSDRRK
jgi:YidC/Oxa1 family membrane protein insertase